MKELPAPVNKGYVLADSWYSCEALFNVSTQKGFKYLGKINGYKKVKIIMSWPKNALWSKHALKCFISLDIELSTKQILKHYLNRWPIETFFRETKRRLGFDKYQIHTIKGIKRYMYLLSLPF